MRYYAKGRGAGKAKGKSAESRGNEDFNAGLAEMVNTKSETNQDYQSRKY
jgi:hypothetical protein